MSSARIGIYLYVPRCVRIAKNITMPGAKRILIVTYIIIYVQRIHFANALRDAFSFSMVAGDKRFNRWHPLVLVYCRLTPDLLGPSGCSSSCAIFATDYLGKISVLICTR